MQTGERGFVYVQLLFVLALMGAGLAALGERWTSAAQQERETELMFRGQAFATALQRYQAATPANQPTLPLQLADLLADERRPAVVHHLRRVYLDPFTGLADWRLLRDADGRICAVASRSSTPARRRQGVPLAAGANPERARVADWHFGVPCRQRPNPSAPPAATSPRSR
jgi:type II secretory pathway pseudopilin PulG